MNQHTIPSQIANDDNSSIVEIFETPHKIAESVASLIQQKAKAKAANNEQLMIAVSGGNTPKLLFDLLAKEFKNDIPWNNVRFYWVDERCVAPNHEESNYGVVKELLFNIVDIKSTQIERMIGENTPSEEAIRYSDILSSQLSSKNGAPFFDLILLGMGDDGHTASIFPNQLDLTKSENFCEVGEHPTSGQKRVTLTTKLINNAAKIIFLVTGKNKASILKEIIQKEENYLQYPSAHIHATHGKLIWMVDKEAAINL